MHSTDTTEDSVSINMDSEQEALLTCEITQTEYQKWYHDPYNHYKLVPSSCIPATPNYSLCKLKQRVSS